MQSEPSADASAPEAAATVRTRATAWLRPILIVSLGVATYWLPALLMFPLAMWGMAPLLTSAVVKLASAVVAGLLARRQAELACLAIGYVVAGCIQGGLIAAEHDGGPELVWQFGLSALIPGGLLASLGLMAFTGRRTLSETGLRGVVRQPGWGRFLVIVALGAASMGLGLGGIPIPFPLGIIGAAVLAGGVASRRIQLLGLVLGLVLTFTVMVVREMVDHGAPPEAVMGNIPYALIPGAFATMLGLLVLTVRQAVSGVGLRRLALRGTAVVLALGLVGVGYVLVASGPAELQSYTVTGERQITVTAGTGSGAWCRASSRETATDITVGVACTSLILGPSTAALYLVPFVVDLAAAPGDRTVLDERGRAIARRP